MKHTSSTDDKFTLRDDSAMVKITTYGHRFEVYLDQEVSEGFDYTELCHLFRRCTAHDFVDVYLGGYGGSCHGFIHLLSAIRSSKAGRIVMHLVSPSYSAHSSLALAGHHLVFYPHTFLMFHNYSSMSYGKGAELMKAAEASKSWISGYMRDVHAQFLTTKELGTIEQDQDLYVYASDKDVDARVKRHFKTRKQYGLA